MSADPHKYLFFQDIQDDNMLHLSVDNKVTYEKINMRFSYEDAVKMHESLLRILPRMNQIREAQLEVIRLENEEYREYRQKWG